MIEPSFLNELPLAVDLETKAVLKASATAHRHLAELKGLLNTIPNQAILINSLSLQEAKDSSAIENIITTHDEMYKATLFPNDEKISVANKEVQNYARALHLGFTNIRETGMLTCRHILAIQEVLEGNTAGFRTQSGTVLRNDATGQIIHTPPQDHAVIIKYMSNLERYINDDDLSDIDPLIKMAIIHHQFETIHPFFDGNGRTGRIINILYLVLKDLLDIPVLYLSQYIIQTKSKYYRLLQTTRDTNDWEDWVIYMLESIAMTAQETIKKIIQIKELMQLYKLGIREKFGFYSQDLLNHLFKHPYTKIEFLEQDLQVSRLTATKYLDALVKEGYLTKHKVWRSNYYINEAFFNLLTKPMNIADV